ncbi:MAG: primase-helicase family protein, partial [Thermoguttaceae bacterium]
YHRDLETHFEPVEDDDDLLDEWAGRWPILGKPHAWTIPAEGSTDPTANDGAVDYHPNLIGCFGTSWWNWKVGQTEGCMFDFDFGHGAKALDEAGIAKIDELSQRHPAIMATASKGGGGRHWAIFVDPMPAKTRKDHSRNCHAILAHLSGLLGVNLADYACSHGVIQYIYHYAPKPGGFRLIRSATVKLKVDPPPPLPPAPEPDPQAAKHDNPGWDAVHESIFATMTAAGFPAVRETRDGKHRVRLHTHGLLVDFQTNRRSGRYSTDSTVRHPQEPNAFAYPLPNGGLDVYRYNDTGESDDWNTTKNKKTRIKYNVPVSFEEAATACGTLDRRGDVVLSDPNEFARLLGLSFQVPELLNGRPVVARRDRRSLFISIEGAKSARDTVLPGWRYYRGKWECDLVDCLPEPTITYHEESVRQTTDEEKAQDWVIRDSRGNWISQSLTAVKTYLKGEGHSDAEVSEILHNHMDNNFQLQRIPFGPEYLPGRIWNRFGARLACQPEKGDFPHIQMILDHWGRNLNAEVQADEWCQRNGVKTGGGYLKLWAAVVVRHPDWRLPYLFGYSKQQNIGKSTLPRTLCRMFHGPNGWAELRKEITRDDFNDQMHGAALCFLEEIDLSTNYPAYHLIKNLVDNPFLKIRGIYVKAITVVNYTHLIQTANERHFCVIFPRDKRIIIVRVDPFTGLELDWTTKLRPLVDQEMPGFLHHIINELELPPSAGRLYLPVLETEDKRQAMAERAAQSDGWFGQLREFAYDGWLENKTAAEILQIIAPATTDPRMPKTAAGVASQLKQFDKAGKFKTAGLTLTCIEGDKHHPTKYTLKPAPLEQTP